MTTGAVATLEPVDRAEPFRALGVVAEPTGPHDVFIATDLSDEHAVGAAIDAVAGPVHALFNNAGVADTQPPYTVFAVTATGAASAAVCQPDSDSFTKVTLDSSAPDDDQRLPTCAPVLAAAL